MGQKEGLNSQAVGAHELPKKRPKVSGYLSGVFRTNHSQS